MKKHDLLSVVFLLSALTGAALVYLDMTLAGQITYVVSMIGASLLTKTKAAPIQAWIAFVIACGFGYITGDWWHSAAIVCAYLAITLRIFVLTKRTFTSLGWQEPMLALIGIGIYVAANIIHDNGWQGWVFPGPTLLIGTMVALINLSDRVKVRKMIENNLIEVGTPAPDFCLPNYDGKEIALSHFKGKRDMLLIFVRGDWCPSCHIMLRHYEKERKKFQDKNVMLFAIGPDPIGVNRAMVEKLGVDFAVLTDDIMEVSKSYCLEVQPMGKPFEAGVPLPASFLIDKQGIVRYTSRADNAGEFLSPDLIFDVLARI